MTTIHNCYWNFYITHAIRLLIFEFIFHCTYVFLFRRVSINREVKLNLRNPMRMQIYLTVYFSPSLVRWILFDKQNMKINNGRLEKFHSVEFLGSFPEFEISPLVPIKNNHLLQNVNAINIAYTVLQVRHCKLRNSLCILSLFVSNTIVHSNLSKWVLKYNKRELTI